MPQPTQPTTDPRAAAIACWNSFSWRDDKGPHSVVGLFEHPTREEFIERYVFDLTGTLSEREEILR